MAAVNGGAEEPARADARPPARPGEERPADPAHLDQGAEPDTGQTGGGDGAASDDVGSGKPESGEAEAGKPESGEAVSADAPAGLTPRASATKVSRWTEFRTGDWPIVPRIDLSDAYAAVRRRGKALRRRRIISTVLASVVMAGLLSVVGVYYVNTIPLPDALSLPATTTVYYSDGVTVMARLGSQRRTIVDPSTLPQHVKDAVLAAEDPAYFTDSAALISRQYARAAAGVDSSTASGEARLLVMTWKLEDSYSKDQILGFYLNTVYFGRGAFGVEAAAQAYFGKHATSLTVAESIVLAGLIASPGDGRFDPTVDPVSAQQRFREIASQLVLMRSLDQTEAARLSIPRVISYDPAGFESDLDRPTGLVVSQILAELRQTEPFRGRPPGFIENGGYAIVSTVDARTQAMIETTASEASESSVMHGQPRDLQAAAVAVEPGTGRVLGYFGGSDGTGADYAGWYVTASNGQAGFGAHPPGQTFGVYALAAAVADGISVKSTWDSPQSKDFADLPNPVRDVVGAPCQPVCSLVDATTAPLSVPFVSLTERLGPAKVVDLARAAGIDAMWLPETDSSPRQRFDVAASSGASLTPEPFGPRLGLGDYPVTVVDQANAMATFAAGGVRARAHFVRRVTKDFREYFQEPTDRTRAVPATVAADLSWTLTQNPLSRLDDGRPVAIRTGVARLRTSAVDNAHAWAVGYTPNLAVAVWVGNEELELPLKDREGARVTGETLPTSIFRTFMSDAHQRLALPRLEFPTPTLAGDIDGGDAP